MFLLLAAFALALGLSLYGTPLAARAARRYGILDRPDGALKRQSEGVPYLGGLAVYVAFLLSYGIVFDYDARVLGLLLAASIVVTLGLLDDFGALTPAVKFAGQLVACFVLVRSDVALDLAFLPDWANVALSVLWLAGMMNAFNIIDVMDGLAAGSAFCAASSFLFIAVLQHHRPAQFVAACTIGAALGFLRYNYPPARIYLGDTGSMFLGLVLGSFALLGDYSHKNFFGFLTPLFILSVPLFDTFFVSFLRLRQGKRFYFGSPDHYALRLRRRGWSVPAVVNASCAATLAGGALGAWNLHASPRASLAAAGLWTAVFAAAGFWLARVDMRERPGDE
jgi:UDP-GlcNAc:undecaprenyl-phosphate GlcNAc-1-phosphate transferase